MEPWPRIPSFEIAITLDCTASQLPCAVKRVASEAIDRDALEARLLAEGAMLQELDGGAGVLRCFEIRRDPVALLLELATGGSLADRISPLDRRSALEVFRAVTAAVAHAHAHGIVHRDIKPSNILFTATNEIRLSDFGVGVRRGARSTADGWEDVDAGTLGYAAPELLSDPASANTEIVDVYGLGALLHELLLGAAPHMMHGAESEVELRARIVAGAPRDVTERETELSSALRRLLDAALDPDPSARPQSIAELLALL